MSWHRPTFVVAQFTAPRLTLCEGVVPEHTMPMKRYEWRKYHDQHAMRFYAECADLPGGRVYSGDEGTEASVEKNIMHLHETLRTKPW